jgi:hypothetical protein
MVISARWLIKFEGIKYLAKKLYNIGSRDMRANDHHPNFLLQIFENNNIKRTTANMHALL